MQKVYLLLRNNQQTGPYSFEELLQLQLKPFDLVWVEGKSYGWRYPTEVETLKHYFTTPEPALRPDTVEVLEKAIPKSVETISSASANKPKKIFVSLPSTASGPDLPKQNSVDSIEQKAEELRKRAQAYVPQHEPIQTNYSRELQEAEEEYTDWMYQKKTKKKRGLNKNWLTIAAISAVIVSGGWWALNHFSNTPVEKPLTVEQTKNETGPDTTLEPTIINETASPENISIPKTFSSPSSASVEPNKETGKTNERENKVTAQQPATTLPDVVMADESIDNPIVNTPPPEPEREVVATTPAGKKTLKEKVGDLFKKRKTVPPVEVSQPTPTENSNGERTATHRNENAESNSVLTDLSEQVEIKTNKIADSWMMGVKNLKLTLYNRSNLTINSAKVEVLYYSEQNNLLEKRILSFSDISPRKSQTVAAPNQRLADHIEYKIISATGRKNAYAKQ